MKRELIEFVESDKFDTISFNGIKKYLGISKKHMNEELTTILKTLELEGLLYEDKNGLYKKLPSNYFITTINETKRGNKYYERNNERITLNKEDLKGALFCDKVIINTDTNKVEKILLRNLPNLVCEVRLDNNGKKYLYPINTNNGLEVTIGTKDMKHLLNGQRVLIEVFPEMYEDKYVGKYIKTIGNTNDPDIDFKTIAYMYGFNLEFPEDALKQASLIPDEVTESDFDNRIDLTNEVCFTIDGIDCKDMDDAVNIKRIDNGYLLKVHIAHVSHYVKMNSPLFNEAVRRGNSLYFPDSVIPMLPEKLSSGICSLNPNVNRLTRTFEIELDNTGKVKKYTTYKSVIKSRKKMNYDDVYKVITGHDVPGYEEYKSDLLLLKELSEKLTNIKHERGYISLGSEELKFTKDSLGNTNKIEVIDENISHKIIENCMLLPNELVTYLYPGYPFDYRNHENPSKYKLTELILKLKELGIITKNIRNIKPNFLIQNLLEEIKDTDNYLVISKLILTSMKLAYYGTENKGHFGLALENGYTHYTSPIRRVSDLTVHNLLDIYESGQIDMNILDELNDMLSNICTKASYMERQADKAEYEADKLELINYIKKHMGEEVTAYIDKIYPEYISIIVPGLMDGIIEFDDLPERTYMTPAGKLKGVETGRMYKVGHKVLVSVKSATYVDKLVYYKLIDNLTLTESESKKLTKNL